MAQSLAQSYPELTEMHLLNVFLSSGITFENVTALRLLLGLPGKEYSDSRSPPIHAMETVMDWQKKEPLSLEKTHKVLAEKFKKINLTASIPLLHGGERDIAVDPTVMIDFLTEQSKSFSMIQAREFGNKLKDFFTVNISDMKATMGMNLVMEIFDNINQGNKNLKQDLIDKIIEALHEAAAYEEQPTPLPHHCSAPGPLHINEQPAPLPRPMSAGLIHVIEQPVSLSHQTSLSLTSTNEQAGTVETDDGNHDLLPPNYSNIIAGQENERENICGSQQCNIKRKYWYIAIILLIVGIPYIITLLCLSFLPTFIQITPIQTIIPNDVVLFKIPHSYWLTHINIDLRGPYITGCHAEVISIKCEDVVQNTYTSIRYGNHLNYLYIENKGMISFTLSNSSDEYCSCSPYYAWTFTTIQSAISNVSNNFKNLACGNPPENVHCADLSEIKTFMSPESSYYYIRCNNRDDNCTQVDISINSSRYDFESSEHMQIDSVLIFSQETEESIQLRSFLTLDDPICLLMKLDRRCSAANPSIYQVAITGMNRRYDFLLYPTISFVLIISIFCVICVGSKLENFLRSHIRTLEPEDAVSLQQLMQQEDDDLDG